MSIELILLGDHIYGKGERTIDDLEPVLLKVKEGMETIRKIPVETILDLFHSYSRGLVRNEEVNWIEGVPFLSNWMRKGNLLKILARNIGDVSGLEEFSGDGKKLIKAQPRGVVCHWIAGNVPTLALFSLFQSMLVRNGNILRVPEGSHDTVIPLLKVLSQTKLQKGPSGSDLLGSIAVVYFPSSDRGSNEKLSMAADARVVWGGQEAVDAITGLPRMSHCEDVVFGPKYSFAVVDKTAIGSKDLTRILRNLVYDVITFDQSACSSPHVIFFEKGSMDIREIGNLMAEEFRKASKRFPKRDVDQNVASNIIRKRAEYGLDPEKDGIFPEPNDWTILIDDHVQLEDPIQSRTVFIKPVDSIMDTAPLVTHKVQTVGCAVGDRQRLLEFADAVTYRGVARCVQPGQMNNYDSPWDGIYLLSRLVRWDSLYLGKEG